MKQKSKQDYRKRKERGSGNQTTDIKGFIILQLTLRANFICS